MRVRPNETEIARAMEVLTNAFIQNGVTKEVGAAAMLAMLEALKLEGIQVHMLVKGDK